MIIDYSELYKEDVKNLLLELQEHIHSVDPEGYNIVGVNYREMSFLDTMEDVKKYNGKIMLYVENDEVLGMVIGLINNDTEETYNFRAPKRGRISELVVKKDVRSKGIGSMLLKSMEDYLHSVGCESILIGVFAYNNDAVKFYEKNGYHSRMLDMIK
jgi:ribosomal protein S18 acetylase RimI-like enzyme